MQRVTVMLVNEETKHSCLVLGSGETVIEAIDNAILSPEAEAVGDGYVAGGIFPGHMNNESVREWLKILFALA